jgi:dihydroorotase
VWLNFSFINKNENSFTAPLIKSMGLICVKHALVAMLELVHQGVLKVHDVANLMSHRVATAFQISHRGYIRPGYQADLVLVQPDAKWTVSREGMLYKCQWSPFEGVSFRSRIAGTWVNGVHVYDGQRIATTAGNHAGQRLTFER